MCEGSIHVAHRNATEVEQLEVRGIPNHGIKGLYSTKDAQLVCIRRPAEMVIRKVDLLTSGTSSQFRNSWHGKINVVVTFLPNHFGNDMFVFPDNSRVCIAQLRDGTRVDLGIPVVTGKKGMRAIERALHEQDATTPTPAPEPDQKPAEPAPTAPAEPKEDDKPKEIARRRTAFSRFIV